eukprot:10951928-Heterocapsa_arctica.AAC.1
MHARSSPGLTVCESPGSRPPITAMSAPKASGPSRSILKQPKATLLSLASRDCSPPEASV